MLSIYLLGSIYCTVCYSLVACTNCYNLATRFPKAFFTLGLFAPITVPLFLIYWTMFSLIDRHNS